MNEFKSINEAVESIDFQAISDAMKCLNWTYFSRETPTPTELMALVFELYNSITLHQDSVDTTKQSGSCVSGGFTVTKTVYTDTPELVGVSFTISQNLIVKE